MRIGVPGQRHGLVDVQHLIGDRADQVGRVEGAVVVQRDRVVHAVAKLAVRIV